MKKQVPGLSSEPLFRGDSDLVAKFVEGGGTDGVEGVGDFSMREFSEVDESVLPELESFPAGEGAGGAGGNLGEEGPVLFQEGGRS